LTEQNKVILSFRGEIQTISARLQDLHNLQEEERARVETIAESVESIIDGLHNAAATATPPASGSAANTEIMPAVKITRTRTSGKWYYKILGGKYVKRGVTIWSEGLAALNLDPAKIEWQDDDSHTFPTPFNVTVLLKEYTDDSGQTKPTPQKVIGKA
jgi:hypothetical protein